MKFIIVGKLLTSHLKSLKVALKASGKPGKFPRVKISAAENCTVSMQGFMQELECEVAQWGTASLPLEIWKKFLEAAKSCKKGDSVTVTVGDGYIKLNGYTVEHLEIIPEPAAGIADGLPINANQRDVIEFALKHDIELLISSNVWNTVRASFKELQKQVRLSRGYLKGYGVSESDLAGMIVEKLTGERDPELVEKYLAPL